MKHRYLVVIEKGESNYSAYSPDVPGCVTVGDTVDETIENMQEALGLYFETMQENGDMPPPVYSVHAVFVEFEVPAATVTTSSSIGK